MAHRRSAGRFTRPPKKTTVWIGFGVGVTALGASGRTLVGVLNAAALALRPFTILRSRQQVGLITDQESAAELPFGSLGAIVVTDTASGIGVTAISDPGTVSGGDPDADWFLHQSMFNDFRFITGVGFQN